MPDGVQPSFDPAAAFAAGAAKMEAWLKQLRGEALSPLGPAELALYKARATTRAWRLAVPFPDAVRRLDILLPPAFPWKPPLFALVDRPPFLTWPHVEKDGVLCLASDGMEVDADDPVGVLQRLLGEASAMVERLVAGDFADDFRDEFLSYWDHGATHTGVPVVSLLRAAPPSRVVQLWRGKAIYLLGEDRAAIEAWLLNRFGSLPAGFATENAPFAWIEKAMIPAEYPESPDGLRRLIPDAVSWRAVARTAAGSPEKLVTVLGMTTTNGPALAAVLLTPAPAQAHGARQPLTRGFRPGNVPQDILSSRYLGGAKLTRASVTRADPAWIHGRGRDARAESLRRATVVIVGCGSVGAPVALALAQAGVGRLILIDGDILKWANISRHPLGAADIDRPKAKALAERIRRDLPHIAAEPHIADLATILRERPEVLEGADLIVSATGSWAADGELDSWHAATGRSTPIVYGWTEAHACAGHAVLVRHDGDLRSGFDATGLPRLAVTAWPPGSQQQEPACGSVYQPYGPVELAYIHAMIAELALDALLGLCPLSTHRVWATSGERLRRLGGDWSKEWREIAAGEAPRMLERSWTAARDPSLQEAAE